MKITMAISVFLVLFRSVGIQAQVQTPVPMENIRALVTQFYVDVINNRDTAAMTRIISENFVDHYAQPGAPQGREGLGRFLTSIVTAFPDVRVHVEDILVDGSKATARLKIEGTNTGPLPGGMPATGKKATWTGIDILLIENNKISARWSQRDLFGMMRQLGIVK